MRCAFDEAPGPRRARARGRPGWVVLAWGLSLLCTPSAHARIARAPDEVTPPFVGQLVPNVELVRPDGERDTLYAHLAKRPAVILFIRGGSVPHAAKEFAQLHEVVGKLGEAGYTVIAFSPDAPETLDPKSRYALFSDPAGQAALQFGVGYLARADDFDSPAAFAAWRAARAQPEERPILPVPAVFVVDRKGIVLFAHVNVGVRVELSGELLLTAARAYGEAE